MLRPRAILFRTSARLLCVPLFLGCLLAAAAAQFAGDALNGQGSHRDLVATARAYSTAPNTGVLIFKISSERNGTHLDRQALLKLVNLATQSPTWQTTDTASQGPYDQSASLGVFTDIPYGNYDVEVSAVGYLSAHKQLNVAGTLVQQQIEIVLQRDPAAINLDIADAMMSPKIRKDTKRGVSALKSGRLQEAQKYLDEAHKSAPSDSNMNFRRGTSLRPPPSSAQPSISIRTTPRLLRSSAGPISNGATIPPPARRLNKQSSPTPTIGFLTTCSPTLTCKRKITRRLGTRLRSPSPRARVPPALPNSFSARLC
jgi:hypothetical protein